MELLSVNILDVGLEAFMGYFVLDTENLSGRLALWANAEIAAHWLLATCQELRARTRGLGGSGKVYCVTILATLVPMDVGQYIASMNGPSKR
jgi:hypothetical protein